MPRIDTLLGRARQLGASDLHIAAGSPPMLRILGDLKRAEAPPLGDSDVEALLLELLGPEQRAELETRQSVDLAYEVPSAGRYRANVFRARGGLNGVFRIIPLRVPTIDSLVLPAKVKELVSYPNGLVLVTGPAGQGKTCTLAALLKLVNESSAKHILTIEDPIEFIHPRGRSLINQRAVRRDTETFASALRAALREDPDVIMIGELRDADTISNAIRAAETGHLVFGTLMTTSAHKTVDRIIDAYPANQQSQVRTMLSESLRAIVSQKLVRQADGHGMVAATEILIATPPVANLIREAKTFQIPSVLQTGRALGMHRLEESLRDLVKLNAISSESALEKANDPRTLRELLGMRP
ncbi:MAG: type IV pilus twitching motility protein PilT [bacterium]